MSFVARGYLAIEQREAQTENNNKAHACLRWLCVFYGGYLLSVTICALRRWPLAGHVAGDGDERNFSPQSEDNFEV